MNGQKQAAEALVGVELDGSYRIEGLLGEGGMGAVYRATHLRLEKRVAVKVMARELTANSDALTRFHREALVTSGLGHPHIVQVFDFSTTPSGEPFMVMEFLEGEDLEHRLRRVRQLPAPQVARIVRQVASALAATHAKTIVHRDLKPGNIYLLEVAGEPDFVKVLDFGISKIRSATTRLTRTSSVMGTPNYMSPEQARGKVDEIDERTDQWALACIAWECLTGERLFVGEEVPSILFQIVHEPPPPLASKVSGLPAQVEQVLLRGLAKDKSQRFSGINELAEAFEAAVAGATHAEAIRAPLPAPTMRLSDPARTTQDPTPPLPSTFAHTAGELEDVLDARSGRPKWIWGAVAATVSVLALAGYLVLRPRPAVTPIPASPSVTPSAPVAAPAPPPPARTLEVPALPTTPPPLATPEPVVPAEAMANPPDPGEAKPKPDNPAKEGRRKAAARLPRIRPPVHETPEPKGPAAVGNPDDPFDRKVPRFDNPFGNPGAGRPAPKQPADPSKPSRTPSKEDRWRVE